MIIGCTTVEGNNAEKKKNYSYSGKYTNSHI
jgi:hypothetical protein